MRFLFLSAFKADPHPLSSAPRWQDGVHSGGRNEAEAEAKYLAALRHNPSHLAAQQGLRLLRQATASFKPSSPMHESRGFAAA